MSVPEIVHFTPLIQVPAMKRLMIFVLLSIGVTPGTICVGYWFGGSGSDVDFLSAFTLLAVPVHFLAVILPETSRGRTASIICESLLALCLLCFSFLMSAAIYYA